MLPPRTHPDRCLGAVSPPRWRVGGGRPAGVCAGHRCHRATQGPVRGGAACRPRSPSASRTRGQAQVDRLPRCRPVLPPEQPRGLPAVPCRIPAPSQSHLFTIRRPLDSEVTDRHRQCRSLRTRLALRLGVPPGPGHPASRRRPFMRRTCQAPVICRVRWRWRRPPPSASVFLPDKQQIA